MRIGSVPYFLCRARLYQIWFSGKLVGIGVYFSKSVQEELFVHYSPE